MSKLIPHTRVMDIKFDYSIFPVKNRLGKKTELTLLIEDSLSYWL